jgi:hypothetical protein
LELWSTTRIAAAARVSTGQLAAASLDLPGLQPVARVGASTGWRPEHAPLLAAWVAGQPVTVPVLDEPLVVYLSIGEVADLMGIPYQTLRASVYRHHRRGTKSNCPVPAPDVWIQGADGHMVAGWLPARRAELQRWAAPVEPPPSDAVDTLDLVGIPEIAHRVGVQPREVRDWYNTHSLADGADQFPAPDARTTITRGGHTVVEPGWAPERVEVVVAWCRALREHRRRENPRRTSQDIQRWRAGGLSWRQIAERTGLSTRGARMLHDKTSGEESGE